MLQVQALELLSAGRPPLFLHAALLFLPAAPGALHGCRDLRRRLLTPLTPRLILVLSALTLTTPAAWCRWLGEKACRGGRRGRTPTTPTTALVRPRPRGLLRCQQGAGVLRAGLVGRALLKDGRIIGGFKDMCRQGRCEGHSIMKDHGETRTCSNTWRQSMRHHALDG